MKSGKLIPGLALRDSLIVQYTNNRAAKQARFLFTNRSKLEGLALAKMHPVVIPTLAAALPK
ncbi:MAG TPA: hypothetical protein PLF89_05130 [bacterium]|nr:hypothetical protein [bacterium]